MDDGPLRVVLDTNVLLVAISSRSKYHWIFRDLLAARYDLMISNEILAEYEEVIGEKFNAEVARSVVRTLLVLPNVQRIQPYFQWKLIAADPDDNKFVDCAVAANAQALVSEDRHFRVLREIDFPEVPWIDIETFASLLKNSQSAG